MYRNTHSFLFSIWRENKGNEGQGTRMQYEFKEKMNEKKCAEFIQKVTTNNTSQSNISTLLTFVFLPLPSTKSWFGHRHRKISPYQ